MHGRVSVYATWATFKDIFNVQRSHLPLQVGWDLPYHGQLTPRQELLNELYRTTTRLDDEDVYDAFQQIPLLDSFADHQPRLLFVGYGETDNWAHAGRYDLVLHSAHVFDHFVEQLWNTLQRLPAYRDQTTFIITTDHGRGSGPVEWKEHGVEEKGSENIWIAVIGPDTAALGERTHTAEVHQAQIAATVAALLGKDYRQAVPAAAAPIAAVLPEEVSAHRCRRGCRMTTRREVLQAGLRWLAAGAMPAVRAAGARPGSLLILGGTGFIGPHLTQEAQRRGWKVTHFNRGKTAAEGRAGRGDTAR